MFASLLVQEQSEGVLMPCGGAHAEPAYGNALFKPLQRPNWKLERGKEMLNWMAEPNILELTENLEGYPAHSLIHSPLHSFIYIPS